MVLGAGVEVPAVVLSSAVTSGLPRSENMALCSGFIVSRLCRIRRARPGAARRRRARADPDRGHR
jgi:hypothetical protein